MGTERVGDRLNQALHQLFATHDDLYLLGEDVVDPYGGAFRITRGLSTVYGDRVRSTPLSEGAIVGVANGLALAGNRAIVEVMFGDFLWLAVDQLVNFATKSVAMYGRPVPMRVVVRCPVGGNRGYGPTHSQSPQKHLVGVPHLALYELSPVHEAAVLLGAALDSGEPAVFFEDKVLYTRQQFADGRIDDQHRFAPIDGEGHWVRIDRIGAPAPDVVVIAAGGLVHRALAAAHQAYERAGVVVCVLVPGRLHPLAVSEVTPLVAACGLVCVVEEAPAGGTWGADVAAGLYRAVWGSLRAPVELVSSVSSVIPAAPHLERLVLVQAETITDAVLKLHGARSVARRDAAAEPVAPVAVRVPVNGATPMTAARSSDARDVVIPVLNTNDTACILTAWLVEDGAEVTAGTALATVETSKAETEIEAATAGTLRHARQVGDEVRFGESIGVVTAVDPVRPAQRDSPLIRLRARQSGPSDRPVDPVVRPTAPPPVGPPPAAGPVAPTRNQQAVAATVTRSHQSIPAAFGAADIVIDAALAYLDELSDRTGAVVDLPALLVKAVAGLQPEFPSFFGAVDTDGWLTPLGAHVGVTVDAGHGLFVPVVRDAGIRDLESVADDLAEFRMNAWAGHFDENALTGASLSVSLNLVDGITLVQPLILPPQPCLVSFGGRQQRVGWAGEHVVAHTVVAAGLSYDHRVINGQAAAEFLSRLRQRVEDPAAAFA